MYFNGKSFSGYEFWAFCIHLKTNVIAYALSFLSDSVKNKIDIIYFFGFK